MYLKKKPGGSAALTVIKAKGATLAWEWEHIKAASTGELQNQVSWSAFYT